MKLSRLFALLPASRQSQTPTHAILSSLLALAWVVEARDPYTGGHLWRVSRYAAMLARAAGLSARDVSRIALGGFLHDLGKISIPDAILLKTERLTDAEYAIVKTHPEIGRKLLARHPVGEIVVDAVYSHHERPDGKGYPQGLGAANISRMAAIVGICDAFDAMTSARPYRKPMAADKAMSIIRENLGTQFDRRLGEVFLQFNDSENLHHVVGHSDDGIPLQHCFTCGPTIVVRRDSPIDERVFCPACRTGYQFKGFHTALARTETHADASDLEPKPDEALIERVVTQASGLL